MGVFDSLNETSNKAVDVGEEFYKKSRAFYKLKIFQQLSMTTGMLCKMALIGSLVLLGFIFFMVALTLYLGEVLESNILACLVVGALLLVLSIVVYLARRQIDNIVVKKLSPKFFD